MPACDNDEEIPKLIQKKGNIFLSTVKSNIVDHTAKEVSRGRKARRLQQVMRNVSDQKLMEIMTKGLPINIPFTPRDVNNANDMFGKNSKSIIGKTTRSKNEPLEPASQHVPPGIKEKHRDVTMCIDFFYVNKVPFLITVGDPADYVIVQAMPDGKKYLKNM